MAVKNLIGQICTDDGWQLVNNPNKDFYLIAIKGTKAKNDTIDPANVKRIKFEIGVDSGIEGKPITVGYVALNFDEVTSSDADLNRITAFTRLVYPTAFYIRVVSLYDAKGEVKGKAVTSISININ